MGFFGDKYDGAHAIAYEMKEARRETKSEKDWLIKKLEAENFGLRVNFDKAIERMKFAEKELRDMEEKHLARFMGESEEVQERVGTIKELEDKASVAVHYALHHLKEGNTGKAEDILAKEIERMTR